MKRLTKEEKRQLGMLIRFYRQAMYRSKLPNRSEYTQKNFAKEICSQAQLSRIENGDSVREQEIYGRLLEKLRLPFERLKAREVFLFDELIKNILIDQNRSDRVIHLEKAWIQLDHFQKLFRNNIVYLHYTYSLEFILFVLNEEYKEADAIRGIVEETLDILPLINLILTLQYLGRYYVKKQDYTKALMYYHLALEHMMKGNVHNPSIYMDLAQTTIYVNQDYEAMIYLNVAKEQFSTDPLNLSMVDYYYSIIYAKAGDYDESIAKLLNARERLSDYPYPVPNRKFLITTWKAIVYILSGNKQAALKVIEGIEEDNRSDGHRFIMAYCRNDFLTYSFIQPHFQKLVRLYTSYEKDRLFELEIAPHLFDYPYPFILLILRDYYQYLKDRKKYKKALELIERYRLLNILINE